MNIPTHLCVYVQEYLLNKLYNRISGSVDTYTLKMCVCVHSVAQSCLTLCYLMDCSLQGSSVHGIFQAKILEQVAIPNRD